MVSLVGVANLFRVHPTCEEQDERSYAHEKQAGGEIWVDADLDIGCIYIWQCSPKDKLAGYGENGNLGR